MENTKVVVMGPADVAAMRKAHKEAEAAYFEAKVGALRFAVDEMANTHEEYTLADLRAMSGLSSMEIVAQFDRHRDCRASCEAGIHLHYIQTGRRLVERKFVEVLPTRVDHLVSRLPLPTRRPIQTRFRFGYKTHVS